MRFVPDNAHCMRHACSYPIDEECPHCKIVALERAALMFDKNGDRIGSGRGYGGGQGVSSQGPSSPFD